MGHWWAVLLKKGPILKPHENKPITWIFFPASTSRLKKQSHMRGFLFGFAQAVPNYGYGLILWYGGYLVENEGLLYKDAFK